MMDYNELFRYIWLTGFSVAVLGAATFALYGAIVHCKADMLPKPFSVLYRVLFGIPNAGPLSWTLVTVALTVIAASTVAGHWMAAGSWAYTAAMGVFFLLCIIARLRVYSKEEG